MAKITVVTARTEATHKAPATFKVKMAEDAAILDGSIAFSHASAQLTLTVLDDARSDTTERTFIAACNGQEHDDLSALEYVRPITARRFTSPMQDYYLFAVGTVE